MASDACADGTERQKEYVAKFAFATGGAAVMGIVAASALESDTLGAFSFGLFTAYIITAFHYKIQYADAGTEQDGGDR